jgi:type I restriction enzyme S subunit
VEWKKLDEVCLKTDNIKWKEHQKAEFSYIDLSSVNRENNKIFQVQKINSKNAPSRAQQIVLENDVIFGTTRPTLKRYSLITSEFHNQICSSGFCVLRANINIILPGYLFFILTSTLFYGYVENNQEGAGYPSISNNKVKQFRIPIPDLSVQERIVSILNNFDKLVNDISTGLPAEIAARCKQYEYYRNNLLTFKNREHG